MFDIGILELGLVAVVALLVIGPERLPAVARTVGFWFGKVRRFVQSVQNDFNKELVKSEELKQLLEEQAKIKDVHEIIEQSVDETRKTVSVAANLTPPLDVLPARDETTNVDKSTASKAEETADVAKDRSAKKTVKDGATK